MSRAEGSVDDEPFIRTDNRSLCVEPSPSESVARCSRPDTRFASSRRLGNGCCWIDKAGECDGGVPDGDCGDNSVCANAGATWEIVGLSTTGFKLAVVLLLLLVRLPCTCTGECPIPRRSTLPLTLAVLVDPEIDKFPSILGLSLLSGGHSPTPVPTIDPDPEPEKPFVRELTLTRDDNDRALDERCEYR